MLKGLLAFVVAALFSASLLCTPARAANVYSPRGNLLVGTDDNVPNIDFRAIRKVKCSGGHGTGFLIDPHTIVTAYHVVAKESMCVDNETGEVLKVVYTDPTQDVAVLHSVQKHPVWLAISCDSYATKTSYFSVGFAGVGATNILVTHLYAIDLYQNGSDTHGVSFLHMHTLAGVIIPGMSGGPIIDRHGRVFGINNLTQNGFRFGLSRELRDTYLCPALKP